MTPGKVLGTAFLAALSAMAGAAEAGTCNYGCALKASGCFTCETGSDLVDCHVSCPGGSVGWGQSCSGAGGAAGKTEPAIQRIHPVQDEVLQLLDPPYRMILNEVIPHYNSPRSEKRNPLEIRGKVLLEGDENPSDFTLTVEERAEGVQIVAIEVETLGAAELTLDPKTRQVSFRLTYNDGRRPIAGRGVVPP